MDKFIVGILIVVFTTYCGIFLSKKYKVRKVFFEEFYTFHLALFEELNFTKRPYEEFYAHRKYVGDFAVLLQEEAKRRIDRKKLPLSLDSYTFLTQDEKKLITEYLSSIGAGDSLSHKAYFSRVENTLQNLKIKSIEECKKYVDLYLKMGFLLGLAILILLM